MRKGHKHTEKTKEKMSLSRLRRKEIFGYINSPETKEKMSRTRKERISNGEIATLLGKHWKLPEKSKKKISEWQIKHPNKTFKETNIEVKMRRFLDKLGIHYFQNYPLENIGNVDFYIPEKRLIIECDGCYYHGCPEHHPSFHQKTKERDELKKIAFKNKGYDILRFWEHEIKSMTALKI